MLFSFFVESARIERKLDIARIEVGSRAALQTRLDTLFTTIDQQSNNHCFFTKKVDNEPLTSLNFIFDNGIDPDPQYSGSVIGRIFLDNESNLCLTTKPMVEDSPHFRKEVILQNIVDFEFEFLGPKGGKRSKERAITPQLAWKKEWKEMQGRVPSIIKLEVQQKNEKEPLQFAVFMPSSDPLIEYVGKKAL